MYSGDRRPETLSECHADAQAGNRGDDDNHFRGFIETLQCRKEGDGHAAPDTRHVESLECEIF